MLDAVSVGASAGGCGCDGRLSVVSFAGGDGEALAVGTAMLRVVLISLIYLSFY